MEAMQGNPPAKVLMSAEEEAAYGIPNISPKADFKTHGGKSSSREFKKMPQSLEAEKGVLGSILLGGEKTMYLVERKCTAEHFHNPVHRTFYEILREMFDFGVPIDLVTVTQQFEDRGMLENIGGAGFVTEMYCFVPTPENVSYYIDIMVEKNALREIILFAEKTRANAFDLSNETKLDAKLMVAKLMQEISRIEAIVKGNEEVDNLSFSDLANYDTNNDANTVLGSRWLCKGGGCLWVGQSGLGKSSLAMQAAITWAQGKSLWGVKPPKGKRLKSLFIQAENDEGDLAEMLQGVLMAAELPEGMTRAQFIEDMNKYIVFHRDVQHTGHEFGRSARRLIDKFQPDLVWADPLLSYVGDDLSKQAVASEFLREILNPIAMDTGIVWMLLHHTGKPPSDPKAKSGWTDHDFSYDAFGSSELVNWARAVNVLKSLGEGVFELRFAKRGKRAGLREYDEYEDRNGEYEEGKELPPFTTVTYLKHAEKGIFWDRIETPSEIVEKKKSKENGQSSEKVGEDTIYEIMMLDNIGRKAGQIQALVTDDCGVTSRTFYRHWNKFKKGARCRQDAKTKLWFAV